MNAYDKAFPRNISWTKFSNVPEEHLLGNICSCMNSAFLRNASCYNLYKHKWVSFNVQVKMTTPLLAFSPTVLF